MWCFIGVVVVLCSCLPQALAQVAGPETFVCAYSTYSTATGVHTAQPPQELIVVVNRAAHKAYVTSTTGMAEVSYIPQDDGMTLIEKTAGGHVMVTAITKDGISVHSRHPITDGYLLASQAYGRCTERR
jgi:hypothetical protein